MEFLRQFGQQQQQQNIETVVALKEIKTRTFSQRFTFHLEYDKEIEKNNPYNLKHFFIGYWKSDLLDDGIFSDTWSRHENGIFFRFEPSDCTFKLGKHDFYYQEKGAWNDWYWIEDPDTPPSAEAKWYDYSIPISSAPSLIQQYIQSAGLQSDPKAIKIYELLKGFECPPEIAEKPEQQLSEKSKSKPGKVSRNLPPSNPPPQIKKIEPVSLLKTDPVIVTSQKTQLSEISIPKIAIKPTILRTQIHIDNGCVDESVFDQFCAIVKKLDEANKVKGLTKDDVKILDAERKRINELIEEMTEGRISDFIKLPSGERNSPESRSFYAPYESTCARRSLNKEGYISISH